MRELVCLSIFVIISAMLAIAMIVAGLICQYKKSGELKESTYECGVPVFSDAKIRYDIKYFNYAAAFLIFDVETIFLYPYAVAVNKIGQLASCEILLFVIILLCGLYFGVQKKFLRWL